MEELLKVCIYTEKNQEMRLVSSQENINKFKDDWANTALFLVEIAGRINDLDANDITFTFHRDAIILLEVLTANKM